MIEVEKIDKIYVRNVLSLFDGCSGGQLALNDLGIKYCKYYASEIDTHAIAVTNFNFPETVQLGDVTKLNAENLPVIDLLMGGSPCTQLSNANSLGGGLEGKDSSLFFEYLRLLKELKPKYFLLENVKMKKEWEQQITDYMGVEPILINSSNLSAQNRQRLYWTNIPNIQQPEDQGIKLKDILEQNADDRYYLSDKTLNALFKYNERQVENSRGFSAKFRDVDNTDKMDTLKIGGGGTADLICTNREEDAICVASRGREQACLSPKRTLYGKEIRKAHESGEIQEQRKNIQQLEPRFDEKTNALTTITKDNLIMTHKNSQGCRVYDIEEKSVTLIGTAGGMGAKTGLYHIPHGYKEEKITEEDKYPTLHAMSPRCNHLILDDDNKANVIDHYNNTIKDDEKAKTLGTTPHCRTSIAGQSVIQNKSVRRLTPLECERLQTVPDNYTLYGVYTDKKPSKKFIIPREDNEALYGFYDMYFTDYVIANVAETNRYKLMGNGWTIKVISHILSFIDSVAKPTFLDLL